MQQDKLFLTKWIGNVPDDLADQMLVLQVSSDMRKKLMQKREEGKRGWHSETCDNQMLLEMLKEHIDKGDMIDVINFAAMIHCRTLLLGDKA